MSKVFLDTNILVYALDPADKAKQKKARKLLLELKDKYQGVVSTQVLQEFYVVATTKLGLEPLVAKEIIKKFQRFEVIDINSSLIYEAIDCSVLNKLSFWDALVVASASSANCSTLWTEDLNSGQVIRDVKIENPF